MENKLIQTGNWYWRTGEISLKDYYILPADKRKIHLDFLLSLNPSQRSTGDNIILLVSRTKEQNDKFFEL
jgi:hypothetical protein